MARFVPNATSICRTPLMPTCSPAPMASQLTGTHFAGWWILADIQKATNKIGDALASYERLLACEKIPPYIPDVHFQMACINMALGKFTDAMDKFDLERRLKRENLGSTHPRASLGLAEALCYKYFFTKEEDKGLRAKAEVLIGEVLKEIEGKSTVRPRASRASFYLDVKHTNAAPRLSQPEMLAIRSHAQVMEVIIEGLKVTSLVEECIIWSCTSTTMPCLIA